MIKVNDFKKIVIEKTPLIDLRAPIEYERGSFINSINLPIMNNEERHLIGICYKENGNKEAVKLGHKLVSGDIRSKRINDWVSHINKYPNSLIYCFRGGSRSKICQQWITEETGKNVPYLEGGYKAFRNYLIKALDPSFQKSIPIRLGGYTGSGKTILLKKLKNSVDLEGIANHRGSSFGQFITPQPSQIDFENNLAYALINHKHNDYTYMILEDEGRHIGKCYIPKPLVEYFNQGKLVVMNVPVDERVQITLKEYVIQAQAQYISVFGDEKGPLEWFENISNNFNRLKKRLGSIRYNEVCNEFNQAFKKQLVTGRYDSHANWIKFFLENYYDPMYKYQLQNTSDKIIFKGNADEVLMYLRELQ